MKTVTSLFLLAMLSCVSMESAAQDDPLALPTISVSASRIVVCANISCDPWTDAGGAFDPDLNDDTISQEAVASGLLFLTELVSTCQGSAEEREAATWSGYRQALQARYNTDTDMFGLIQAQYFDNQMRTSDGQVRVYYQNNGGLGVYERTDSELGASDGFVEVQAPNCGS